MKATGKLRKYLYEDDKKWFSRFQPFLGKNVLKVGEGLGYLSSFIKKTKHNLSILDIQTNNLSKNKVIIYDGRIFPFKDRSFDCVVCTYVLHHTPNPLEIFDEMNRVSKRVILIEETYENLFAKLDLVYRDIRVNLGVRQGSKIHWNSYFKKGELETIFKKRHLRVLYHHAEKKRTYWKELFIVK
jgi:ubiquinone/menaquinone biosynthesis C-methylase UbiE